MNKEIKPPVGGGGNDFVQHPAGSYMAVMADVYVKEEENFFYGKPKDSKDPNSPIDTNKTKTHVYLVFLTSHRMPNGDPSYVRARFTYTWGGTDKPSNLFKMIQGWYPTATPERIRDMDLNKIVGQQAYITVTHNDKGYASVSAASQAPPGAEVVTPHASFKRYEEKNEQAQEQPVQQAVTSDPSAAYAPPRQPDTTVPPSMRPPLPTNPGAGAVHQGTLTTKSMGMNPPDGLPF